LAKLELEEQQLYNQRRAIGQIADQKKKYVKEQPYYPDVPKEPVSASELIRQQQEILAKNGENQRKRQNLQTLQAQAETLRRQIEELLDKQTTVLSDLEIAKKSAQDLKDESTAELEQNIAGMVFGVHRAVQGPRLPFRPDACLLTSRTPLLRQCLPAARTAAPFPTPQRACSLPGCRSLRVSRVLPE